MLVVVRTFGLDSDPLGGERSAARREPLNSHTRDGAKPLCVAFVLTKPIQRIQRNADIKKVSSFIKVSIELGF